VHAHSWRECFSDQHYFASLLALNGSVPAACNAMLTTSSTSDAEHAHSFTAQEVSLARCAGSAPEDNFVFP
jgi:hypothetical protein